MKVKLFLILFCLFGIQTLSVCASDETFDVVCTDGLVQGAKESTLRRIGSSVINRVLDSGESQISLDIDFQVFSKIYLLAKDSYDQEKREFDKRFVDLPLRAMTCLNVAQILFAANSLGIRSNLMELVFNVYVELLIRSNSINAEMLEPFNIGGLRGGLMRVVDTAFEGAAGRFHFSRDLSVIQKILLLRILVSKFNGYDIYLLKQDIPYLQPVYDSFVSKDRAIIDSIMRARTINYPMLELFGDIDLSRPLFIKKAPFYTKPRFLVGAGCFVVAGVTTWLLRDKIRRALSR